MRSLVFEGSTWAVYERLRETDKKLHKALCKVLTDMLRNNPATGWVNQSNGSIASQAFGLAGYHKRIESFISLMINTSISSPLADITSKGNHHET